MVVAMEESITLVETQFFATMSMRQEMDLACPMPHENGSMQFNFLNDMVKLTLLSKVTSHL